MSLDEHARILIEAKDEYTRHLVNLLSRSLYQGILSVYNVAREECDRIRDPQYLRAFQLLLKQIPKWNQEVLDQEYERIISEIDCEWLDKLVKAVFLAYIKVLSSVRMGNSYKKVKIGIPIAKNFIHKCYIESARAFYYNPHIFSHKVSEMDYHRNTRAALDVVNDSIKESIRKLLPVRQILDEYLDGGVPDSEPDITKPYDKHEIENMKQLVDKDLRENEHKLLSEPQAQEDNQESGTPTIQEPAAQEDNQEGGTPTIQEGGGTPTIQEPPAQEPTQQESSGTQTPVSTVLEDVSDDVSGDPDSDNEVNEDELTGVGTKPDQVNVPKGKTVNVDHDPDTERKLSQVKNILISKDTLRKKMSIDPIVKHRKNKQMSLSMDNSRQALPSNYTFFDDANDDFE